MKKKQVLSVGQCGFDHSNISKLMAEFDAEVTSASSQSDATKSLSDNHFDLILVNRIFDATGESGLDFIAQLKSKHQDYPVMLISNYADAQEKAVELGAEMGFGKSALFSSTTKKSLAKIIGT